MPVVASSYTIDAHAQASGSHYVVESMTLTGGQVVTNGPYLLPAGQGATEAQAHLDASVARLEAHVAEIEFRQIVLDNRPFALLHQTPAEFAARFWDLLIETYRNGNKERFSYLIWWLYGHYQAGDFTSNEVRTTFNTAYGRSLSTAQWNTFVSARLIPIADRYQAILDEADL